MSELTLTKRNRELKKQGLKECGKCHRVLNLSNFHKGASKCKECSRKYNREYHQKNREKKLKHMREYNLKNHWKIGLKYKYNLTPQQYDKLVKLQKGKCACCKHPSKKLEIDHCHKTGKVRGLVCRWCNISIGRREDPRFPLVDWYVNYYDEVHAHEALEEQDDPTSPNPRL